MITPKEESHELAPRQPAIHLAPPTAWMGDPNGLVYFDGTYHAFYQHNPAEDVWGPMHWRHAVSSSLVGWTDCGIALEPDELGTIFSGSVVVDQDNTSDLGDGRPGPLVAVFTHDHEHLGQRQSLAYSNDRGATWTKFDGNPVLTSDAKDFRDPKVRWFPSGPDPHWVMSLAVGDRVEFYRSPNLIDWAKASDFTADVSPSRGVWECPDLITVGGPNPTWALLVSIIDAGPHGHSGVVAFTGRFDGERFEATSGPHRLDHGPDFYAAQSFANVANDPIVVGWMNSWRYANTHPSRGRRGIHSLPRTFSVSRDGRLRQTPTLAANHLACPSESTLAAEPNWAIDLTVSAEATVAIDGTAGPAASIEIETDGIRLNRFMSGHNHPLEGFEMSRDTKDPVRVIIDHGSVEIFADEGLSVMTALIFPGADWTAVLSGVDAVVRVSSDQPTTPNRAH